MVVKSPRVSAALCAALLGVFPAAAAEAFQPASRAPLGPDLPPQTSSPDADLFGGPSEGLAVTKRDFTEQDGSRSVRRGMIGSWPIAGRLSAGVGLFSVTADARRQQQQQQMEMRRSQNVRDMGSRSQTIAAVGLKLTF